MSTATLGSVPPAVRRRLLVRTLLRAVLTVVVLVAVYYLLPLDGEFDTTAMILLLVGLLALTGLFIWQVRGILRSGYPALRAVSALSSVIPLFLLLFAVAYFVMGRAQTGSFTESLTRTDALYFTVTVFTTVGFGDIAPTTELTRVVAMVQMIADLLVLGGLLRVVLGAVKLGQQRRTGGAADNGQRRLGAAVTKSARPAEDTPVGQPAGE